jgi:hypothetical protein
MSLVNMLKGVGVGEVLFMLRNSLARPNFHSRSDSSYTIMDGKPSEQNYQPKSMSFTKSVEKNYCWF